MVKDEIVETTETIHRIYCDNCGKHICDSAEYDDGYFYNPAEYERSIYLDDWYYLRKELCEECALKQDDKIKQALLKLGYKPDNY